MYAYSHTNIHAHTREEGERERETEIFNDGFPIYQSGKGLRLTHSVPLGQIGQRDKGTGTD